ncbi:MAG: ribosome recycling factor [candidate division NC10 bacterium]|nr:ribosome recycling factor [candidate division NC10 bacterium]MCZ6550790.1 ribosome recycling factor [candidate division NC10 bacterium]
MTKDVLNRIETSMKKGVEAMVRDFTGVRTGRASAALLQGITVECYGTSTPLQQVASVAIPETRLMTIQPWDQSLLSAIEKAILKSDLGITPSSDGRVVRIAIPPLTEERRKELVRIVRRMAEEGRVAIRNVRRDGNEKLKALEKQKQISEDDVKKGTESVQKLTDKYIKEIEAALTNKEKEILEF